MRVIVVMAGGSGERFWPMSRKARPKQLLPLTSEKTLLGETLVRAQALVDSSRVYIVAGAALTPKIREMAGFLPPENFLAEPVGKNTAPCLAFAAGVIGRRHGNETAMAVMSADSRIADVDRFRANADLAFEQAEREDVLMTLGIRPTRPDTGFGYLEIGPSLHEDRRGTVHRVESFREKPDEETARRYVGSGNFLWNSGIFFWRVSTLMAAFDAHCPEFSAGACKIGDSLGGADCEKATAEAFAAWPSISIDYAVMEKAHNVRAVPGEFDWDDVGTWNALARMHPLDEAGNLLSGNAVAIDARDCVIYNESRSERPADAPRTLIAALGVENLVIVQSGCSVLVCRRDRVQDIKQALQRLREEGFEDCL